MRMGAAAMAASSDGLPPGAIWGLCCYDSKIEVDKIAGLSMAPPVLVTIIAGSIGDFLL